MTGLRRSIPLPGLLGLALILAAGLTACKSGDTASQAADENAAESPATGEPGAAPGAAPGSVDPSAQGSSPISPSGPADQVVARVNGREITRGELDLMATNYLNGAPAPTARHDEIRRTVLEDLITKQLLYQKAKQSRVEVSDAEVSSSVARIKADFPDEEAFVAELAKDGLDVEHLENIVRESMVIDKFIQSTILSKVKVSSQEEETFYTENRDRMKHPEQIRASHILLRVTEPSSPEQKQQQRARLEGILERARKGEDFGALARDHSQDPASAPNGGDLGYFARGQMVPAFDTAAWSLEAGQISDIVETDFGYHIVKLTHRRPEGYTPLADARARIREHLTDQKAQQEIEKLTSSLRAAAKVEVTL